MDLQTAQHRIYRWAQSSPLLEDKVACDTVFAALTERQALVGEVAQLRAERGLDDVDDFPCGDPDCDGHPALPQRPDPTDGQEG